jgi:hypothetical protein
VSRVNNLEESCVRTSLNFLSGLVLYGIRYVHCVKIWTAERRSLGPRSRLELPSGDELSFAKIQNGFEMNSMRNGPVTLLRDKIYDLAEFPRMTGVSFDAKHLKPQPA